MQRKCVRVCVRARVCHKTFPLVGVKKSAALFASIGIIKAFTSKENIGIEIQAEVATVQVDFIESVDAASSRQL